MNYTEKTHFENNISINSSKYKSKLTILFFTQNRQVLPLPLIARCGWLGVNDSVDNYRNHKFQVKLHSMLFHLIQANFNFWPNFYVFQRPQSMNVVYAGMVYQQPCTHVLYVGFSKEIHVQYVTCPKDSCIHCAR